MQGVAQLPDADLARGWPEPRPYPRRHLVDHLRVRVGRQELLARWKLALPKEPQELVLVGETCVPAGKDPQPLVEMDRVVLVAEDQSVSLPLAEPAVVQMPEPGPLVGHVLHQLRLDGRDLDVSGPRDS